jgi:hypothetical protein
MIVGLIAGCGDGDVPAGDAALHSVTGQVRVGGKPAAGVMVRLHPLNRSGDPEAPHPYGTTDAEGRFRLRTGEAEGGAPAGQYVATLTWATGPRGVDRLGGAYAEPDGSGLGAVVEDGPTELPPFEVDPPGRTP